jgi:hypothetical protein
VRVAHTQGKLPLPRACFGMAKSGRTEKPRGRGPLARVSSQGRSGPATTAQLLEGTRHGFRDFNVSSVKNDTVLIGNAASAEAEALQQRAERKRGEDAVRAHGQAAVTAMVTHSRLPDTVWCQTNSWLTVSAKRLVARNVRASLAECRAAQAAFQRALDAEQAQALPYERHLDACFGLVSFQPLARTAR